MSIHVLLCDTKSALKANLVFLFLFLGPLAFLRGPHIRKAIDLSRVKMEGAISAIQSENH